MSDIEAVFGAVQAAQWDELRRLIGRSRIVVVPSRAPETFALVGVEAMAQATPVVATSVGGISEWLENEVTGLTVPSGDIDALAGAIDRLMTDEALCDRLGSAAEQASWQQFTPDVHLARLQRLFSTLVPWWRKADVRA